MNNQVKKYKVPEVGDPEATGIISDLRGKEEHVAVLSYLPYKSLINVCKSSKYAFQLIMDRATRKEIQCWKPEPSEETKINEYINKAINRIAVSKVPTIQ
eukprot:TRINITY_DN1472_c0_g1_i12.p1 TRINITY_DN1472_c0_g1~~TRINITY_DN1472_c0_g1_i12.p1  ORF type:complete len:100 (-),score=29.17 TRINITY_DN1472_c0_g1_i12:159-458(-)